MNFEGGERMIAMIELLSPLGDLPRMLDELTMDERARFALTGAGITGALIYLMSFAAVQSGRLRGDSITYSAFNTVAALLVLSSLSVSFNPGAFIIQTSFATIGMMAILLKLRARHMALKPVRARARRISAAARSRP